MQPSSFDRPEEFAHAPSQVSLHLMNLNDIGMESVESSAMQIDANGGMSAIVSKVSLVLIQGTTAARRSGYL
jgi:hypothetical protein